MTEMADEKHCTNCGWALWKRSRHGAEKITTNGGQCTLPLDLPMSYARRDKSRGLGFPSRLAITKWTPYGCKYWIPESTNVDEVNTIDPVPKAAEDWIKK